MQDAAPKWACILHKRKPKGVHPLFTENTLRLRKSSAAALRAARHALFHRSSAFGRFVDELGSAIVVFLLCALT